VRHSFLPSAVLVLVTALLVPYGSHVWAWGAGPVAALVVWGLDRAARTPVRPDAVPVRPTGVLSHRREPEPVD
jgi:hypothetical protein